MPADSSSLPFNSPASKASAKPFTQALGKALPVATRNSDSDVTDGPMLTNIEVENS